MQLQFDKTALPILKMVKQQIKNVEQTQEVRIDEGMPDIGRVLGAWGQVILRTKEWQQGTAGVSGGVQVSVLYQPEEGGDVQAVETWMPFQVRWELPESDTEGTVCVCCLLRNADARNTSSRKLLVRVNVGVCGQLWEPSELWRYAPTELPAGAYLRQTIHTVELPREAGEKSFSLEEEITLPESVPKIDKLLFCCLWPEVIEEKLMSDKVVFRGACVLHLLYRGQDGQLHTWDGQLPFSQYSDLQIQYDQGATADITMAVTSLEAEPDAEGRVQLKAGLVGQYTICQEVQLASVEDAYSPRRPVKLTMENTEMFVIHDRLKKTVPAEQEIRQPGIPVDAVVWPDHPHLQMIAGNSALEMPAQLQLLYRDDDGQYRTALSRWEGQCQVTDAASRQIFLQADAAGNPQCVADGAAMTVKAELPVKILLAGPQTLQEIIGIEFGEIAAPDPERPSLILRRAGQDSLWDMAKTSGSTVEAIMQANDLEAEPAPERMLLIPVM